jgi:hypothetical protein
MVIQNRQRSLAFVLGNLFVATLNEVVNKMVVGGLEQGDMCVIGKYFSIFFTVTGRRYISVFLCIG